MPIPGRRRKLCADCTLRAPDYADEAIFGRRKSTNMNYETSRGWKGGHPQQLTCDIYSDDWIWLHNISDWILLANETVNVIYCLCTFCRYVPGWNFWILGGFPLFPTSMNSFVGPLNASNSGPSKQAWLMYLNFPTTKQIGYQTLYNW